MATSCAAARPWLTSGDAAFTWNPALVTIDLSDTVIAEVGDNFSCNCESLAHVKMPATVREIDFKRLSVALSRELPLRTVQRAASVPDA